MTQARGTLLGIEGARGIAACAVVLYHVARHVDQAFGAPLLRALFQPGHAGVDLFFLLSGFIIAHVHSRDVGKGAKEPARIMHYGWRRFSRLFPIYWIALAASLAMGLATGHPPPEMPRLLSALLLLPADAEPLLGVAWTLQYEVVFYVAFALLIFSRPLGLAVFAGWGVAILLGLVGGAHLPGPAQFATAYNLEFLGGMAIALAVRRGCMTEPNLTVACGLLGILAAGIAEGTGWLDGYGAAARAAYGVPCALLIWGLVAREQRGPVAVPGWLRMLGGASYSIYLFQFIWIGIAWKLLQLTGIDRTAGATGCFALLSTAGVVGGVATAQWLEKPLLAVMRGRRTDRAIALAA